MKCTVIDGEYDELIKKLVDPIEQLIEIDDGEEIDEDGSIVA